MYYSDDQTAYAMLNMIGKHKVVAHGREEYVREDSHINGLKDSGVMLKHGCIIIEEYQNNIFIYI